MHVITGKLSEAAKVFPSSNGQIFAVSLGVKTRDWDKTQRKEVEKWTNYSASFFCKNEQVKYSAFLQSLLVKDTMLVISAEALVAKVYQGQSGPGVDLKMVKPRLMNGLNPSYNGVAGVASVNQQGQAEQAEQAPIINTQYENEDFDKDDIPF